MGTMKIRIERDDMIRKAKVIGEIVYESGKVQLVNPNTYAYTLGVVLLQGVLTKGDVKRTAKASATIVGAVVGTNIVCNLISHIDDIKDA